MSVSNSYDYDIADLSDFRFPGGTSASLAEEIRAQSAGGYTTALVPARSPSLKRKRGMNRRVIAAVQAGQADLVEPDRELRVKVLVIRHPAIFAEPLAVAPRIRADVVVMVTNQTPADEIRFADKSYYDVAAVNQRLEGLFGPVVWAPIGPVVRHALEGTGVPIDISQADWHNVLDADEWRAERNGFVSDRPVIGRHARPHWKKWPSSLEQIEAAYPTDDAFQVKILGGGEVATHMLGRVPSNWTLYPFNSIHPRRFLRGIDFEVYYHHPEVTEAFGRTIAEALASGCPTIVDSKFAELFEDACIYAQPHEVKDVVRALYADPAAYRERSERGHQLVRDRFGYEVHRNRIADLIGQPAGASHGPPIAPKRRSVIFFSANGEGIGHLTRMLALARRAPESIRPIFVTLSMAMKVVRDAGYFCEFIPQAHGEDAREWNPYLKRRLEEIIRRHEVEALVFDGTWPFWGLTQAKAATGLPFAWVRRGMWKRGQGRSHMRRADQFDLIIKPGEFAHAADRGITAARRGEAVQVPPILLLDEPELLEAEQAKAELGLDPGKRAVLLQLGSGNRNDVSEMARVAAERLLGERDLEVVFAEWMISRAPVELPPGVRRLRAYPVGRYLRAFDFAISAAGYNSFHELIAFAVPTIFVPMEKQIDDQAGRTRYAESVGAGINLEPFSEEGLESALQRMLVEEERRLMVEQCRSLFPSNGAGEAVHAIERLLVAAPPEGVPA